MFHEKIVMAQMHTSYLDDNIKSEGSVLKASFQWKIWVVEKCCEFIIVSVI